MKHCNNRKTLLGLTSILLLGLFILAACAPAATPSPTSEPATEAVAAIETSVPTDTVVPTITATLAPTQTNTPQPTATATQTPLPPLALVTDGFRMWCLPNGLDRAGTTDETPQGAWESSVKNGEVSILVPAQACTTVFTFNQPVPQGLKLEILPVVGKTPWLEANLTVSAKNLTVAYAEITHGSIVQMQFWQVSFPYMIVGADGSKFASGEMVFYRSYPGLCWDGSTPVPVTNYCVKTDPKEREPHPENPNYKMVTPPPVPGG
jgi:hypothetical protein